MACKPVKTSNLTERLRLGPTANQPCTLYGLPLDVAHVYSQGARRVSGTDMTAISPIKTPAYFRACKSISNGSYGTWTIFCAVHGAFISDIPRPLIAISFFPTSINHAVCAPRAEKDNPLEGITKNIQRPTPIL